MALSHRKFWLKDSFLRGRKSLNRQSFDTESKAQPCKVRDSTHDKLRSAFAIATNFLCAIRRRMTKNTLWMVNWKFDVFYFQITGLLCLLLSLPYQFWGQAAVVPIYNFYLIIFGLPHNFLTWAHFFPKNVRSDFNTALIGQAAMMCFALCILIPFVRHTDLENWILTGITVSSLWHAYRQHHGICKIYDSIQAQRTGDYSIFADRCAINLFLALGLHTVVIWAFTHERIPFLLTTESMYELIYPRIPWWLFETYLVVTGISLVWGLKRCLYDRYRAGKHLPWPQLGLIAVAVITYVIPYLFVPIEAIPVSIAIGTIFHNIQYFAFVWLAEKNRAKELVHREIPLEGWQKIVHERRWKTFLSITLFYSFAIIVLFSLIPTSAGLVLIYFLAFAHYIVDGLIWRRENNKWLSPTLKRMASLEGV
jgi:hypothetical protein